MNAPATIDTDPIASFALAIRDGSYTTHTEHFTEADWQEAADEFFCGGQHSREALALMMAQDKARAEYDSIAYASECRGNQYWSDQNDFTDWFARQGVRSVAGMVSV